MSRIRPSSQNVRRVFSFTHSPEIAMKSPQNLASVAAVLFLGIYVGSIFNRPADAQSIVGNPSARYQIQTWTVGTSLRGCYVLDTITGRTWYIEGSGQAAKVSGDLH